MNKTQELTKLMGEYPNRELIFMYPSEGSDHPYTLGHPTKVFADEYATVDERIWLRKQDGVVGEELHGWISDNIADNQYEYPLTDEQLEEVSKNAQAEIDKMEWKEVIVVYIGY